MRMRVEAREGVLVVYDAAAPAEGEEGCSGYIGYWLSKRDNMQYIFPEILQTEGDLVAVLLALERDLGVDLQALAHRDDRIEGALGALQEAPNEVIVWEPATLHRAVEIMGFDPGNVPDLNEAGGGQTAALCDPWGCPVSLPPPGNCGSPRGLAREAWAVAVECCPPPPAPCCGGGPTGCVCCGSLGAGMDGGVSSPDGTGTVASCCPPSGACNDGNRCTENDLCENEAVNCPPLTCCGVPKNCNDGDSCTYDLCNPNTGSCVNDPRCSDRNCCPSSASPWYFCCNTGEEICCPTNPAYADHCCDSGETCCGAGCCLPTQTCCNGVCGTKGACCKFDTGSCSEETHSCCDQQGGTYFGDISTCSPADLCRPKCENCHTVTLVMWECGHYASDPLGPCAQDECFENIMQTASCDSFPHRKGPAKCDTYEIAGDPPPPEIVSKSYWLDIPEICEAFEPGGFHPWQELYFGCGEACDLKPNPPTGVRCDTGPCGGIYFAGGDETRGRKKACGCPPPP